MDSPPSQITLISSRNRRRDGAAPIPNDCRHNTRWVYFAKTMSVFDIDRSVVSHCKVGNARKPRLMCWSTIPLEPSLGA